MTTKTKSKVHFDPVKSFNSMKATWKEDKERKERLDKVYSSLLTENDVINFIKKYTVGLKEEEQKQLKREAVCHYVRNLEKQKTQTSKDYKKVNNEILKRAKSEVGGYCTGDMDSDLYKKIMDLQCLGDQLIYLHKAEESQKWINYAIWVSIDNKAVGITNIDNETKRFVNGICKYIHADLQYKDQGVDDIELYDPWISGWNDQRFLINTYTLKKFLTINFQEKIVNKSKRISSIPATPTGPSPIRFSVPNANNTLVDPLLAVDDYTKMILDKAITPYLDNRDHWFEKTNTPNVYKLIIKNPMNLIDEEYKLILGYHGLDTVSLVTTNMLGQRVIVHPDYTELWDVVLHNCFYQISDVETNEAFKYQSEYFWIYDAVDLSTIYEKEIREELAKKLNSVFFQLQQAGVNLNNVRYRFESYNSANDFAMVSDNQGSNPFGIPTNGSLIIVKDNEASYTLNNNFVRVAC